MIPLGISLVVALFVGIAVWSWSDNLGSYLGSVWPWVWGMETFQTVSEILGGIGIVLLGLILYKYIVLAFSAPFMSPVSEKIEAALTGNPVEKNKSGFFTQLWRGMRINLRNFIMEILLSIPILLLGIVPVIGIIAAPLLFLVQAYYAGFGNMDYTLERYYNYKKSITFIRAHRGIAMGNGTLFILLLFIPVIGVLIVLPFSVTAASVSTLQILHPKEPI